MPAGSLEKLKIAVLYGADAIYMGTPDMSLRSKSDMTLDDVVEGIEFAHAHGKRVYLTLNLFSHNRDVEKLPQYIETVRKVKPDGLIIADPGVFMFVKEHAPELELHISTQANVCSWLSVKYWQDQGASLCVMAREVTYNELSEIREKCPEIKLEAFVHGAMCMTYSGRCLLSNFMVERGANQGSCANSCRWKYKVHAKLKDGSLREMEITEDNQEDFEFYLEEEERPGEFMPIQEDNRGSYILNSKDLCLMPRLDDYLRIGVDSLKVEGRGKSPFYVAVVARAYRQAIDDWYADPENWDASDYMDELLSVPNRGYTQAFHDGRLADISHNYDETATLAEWEYAGQIKQVREDAFIVEIKNKLVAGDVMSFVPPSSASPILLRLYEYELADSGKIVDNVHGSLKQFVRIPFTKFTQEDPDYLKSILPEMTIIRKERALSAAQWARLQVDVEAAKIEKGRGSDLSLEKQKMRLREKIEERDHTKTPRLRKSVIEGCCGRGCNGCMVFWHDPLYEKARIKLQAKKQGEKMAKETRQEILSDLII